MSSWDRICETTYLPTLLFSLQLFYIQPSLSSLYQPTTTSFLLTNNHVTNTIESNLERNLSSIAAVVCTCWLNILLGERFWRSRSVWQRCCVLRHYVATELWTSPEPHFSVAAADVYLSARASSRFLNIIIYMLQQQLHGGIVPLLLLPFVPIILQPSSYSLHSVCTCAFPLASSALTLSPASSSWHFSAHSASLSHSHFLTCSLSNALTFSPLSHMPSHLSPIPSSPLSHLSSLLSSHTSPSYIPHLMTHRSRQAGRRAGTGWRGTGTGTKTENSQIVVQ